MKSAHGNTAHLALVLLIFGCLSNLAYAANDRKPDGTSATDDDYENENDSYGEDDENNNSGASNLNKNNPTVMPYFEQEGKIAYGKPGTKLVLDCPVKNYNETKHNILWYKESNPIANGHQPLNVAYQVDANFDLTILEFRDDTPGNYYCSVMPQNVRWHVDVKEGDPPAAPGNHQAQIYASSATIAAMLVLQSFFTLAQHISSFCR